MNYRPNNLSTDKTGAGIYYDEKNRMVYYDWITRKAYHLTKSDYDKYFRYQIILPLCIFVPLLMIYMFKVNILLSLLVGVLIVVGGKALFIVNFLYGLVECRDFVKPKSENFITRTAKEESPAKAITGLILCTVISIVTIINTTIVTYTEWLLYGNYALAAGTAVTAILYLITLLQRSKYHKKSDETENKDKK